MRRGPQGDACPCSCLQVQIPRASGILQMNRNRPFLFTRFDWRRRIDPRNGSIALHQIGNTFLESRHDFPKSFTFAGRSTLQSRQVRHSCLNAAGGSAGDVDKTTEQRYVTRLRMTGNRQFQRLSLSCFVVSLIVVWHEGSSLRYLVSDELSTAPVDPRVVQWHREHDILHGKEGRVIAEEK